MVAACNTLVLGTGCERVGGTEGCIHNIGNEI